MNTRTRKLRAWMTLNNWKAREVAKANRISLNAVYKFVCGKMTSAPLRSWFAKQGCPASYLPITRATTKPPTKTRKAA